MATYDQIKEWVRTEYSIKVEIYWIPHVEQLNGLPVKQAWNRRGGGRAKQRHPRARPMIEETMRALGML